jgi:hypothetical protein
MVRIYNVVHKIASELRYFMFHILVDANGHGLGRTTVDADRLECVLKQGAMSDLYCESMANMANVAIF